MPGLHPPSTRSPSIHLLWFLMAVDGAGGLPTVLCPRRVTGRILPPGCSPVPSITPHPCDRSSSVTQSRGKFGGQLLLAAHCLAASSIPPFPSHQQHHEKPERRSKTPLRALTHAAPLSPSAPGANPKTCSFCSFYPRTGIPGRGSILLSSLPPSLPLALPRHLPAWPGCCGRSRPCSARGRLPGGGGRGARR